MKYFKYILMFSIVILLFGCSKQASSKSPVELGDVEINEYEGEKLSSFDDFRENSIKGPQYIDIDSYELVLSGLVETSQNYKYDQVLEFPKYTKMVRLNCVEGWSVDILWEGVLLKDIFDDIGVKPEANTVIFYAHDGYSTSLPLDFILNNNIIMAYKMNGVEISPERGFPFELVAEQKWGYKWIKWITKIELSDDKEYKGYWEQRGYSNDADLDKDFLE
jgi:DMSO/TMAO reductase YedYZ molybdopterin-dependent catalytic subunit